jgi:very-short-patch-repair endonuclease
MTLPEVILWQELREDRFHGMRFRRQHPIGPYILDFCCSASRLAIEIDGLSHDNEQQSRHDEQRDRWLSQRGIRVLRIAAADVLRDETLEHVLTHIAQVAAPPPRVPRGPPPPLMRGRTHKSTMPGAPSP